MATEKTRLYTCCFFGHRKIVETDELKSKVYNEIEKLIVSKNVKVFLFGSNSEFDYLCHKIVTKLKEKYPHIKRIYVRAEFPYIDNSYRKYLLERYEDTYYPPKITNAGKSAYVQRNHEMINNSGYCICYYDKNYHPSRRKNSNRDLFDYQPKSGTKIAYEYATRKGLTIINVVKE